MESIGLRAQAIGGDAFKGVLSMKGRRKALITAKYVLQDFGDERVRILLHNMAEALSVGDRLVLVEMCTEPGKKAPHYAPTMNTIMAMHEEEGEVRTLEKHKFLLEECGFKFTGATPVWTGAWIIEAERV